MKKHKCPLCRGSGFVAPPLTIRKRNKKEKVKIITELKRRGYSIREIMAELGYKSTNTVMYYLKNKPNE